MTVDEAVVSLAEYTVRKGILGEDDRIWAINRLLEVLRLDSVDADAVPVKAPLEDLLKTLLDYACEAGLCEDSVVYRDLFDTRLMGAVTPPPSVVCRTFREKYGESPEAATDWYYRFSRKTDYIREYRVRNDMKWVTHTGYGDIDITINLSKPEKDPKAIAAAAKMAQSSYPLCQLCPENEGYAGRVNHPARQNHRIIPLDLDGDRWYFQYSPYVYYNEHCIVLDEKHEPMAISEKNIRKLFAFIKLFPHYFVGSNADLPIAGGSILTHEHFQGGRYEFAMARAEVETPVSFPGFDDVSAGIVRWPMSVLRLSGADSDRLCELAGRVLAAWRGYSDESAFIYAETNGEKHNTITPIARKRGERYELDLVLRNNITTAQYPDGVFHPHPEHHHLKKENIGLIEVMGLAVLPARLKTELSLLKDALLSGADIAADERIAKHAAWAEEIARTRALTAENCDDVLRDEVGKAFVAILGQCGVFARTPEGRERFLKFLSTVR